MNIFVTGGSGFIGSHLIKTWLERFPDDHVTNYDKISYAVNPATLKSLEGNPRYKFVHGDICDAELVRRGMKGASIVIHLAAESFVDRSITGASVFAQTNLLGTQVLLEAAMELGVMHFHNVSTDEVFGALGAEGMFDENSPYLPNNPYSASKAGSDFLVRSYFKTYGLRITTTNGANNLGPNQHPEKFIPKLIVNALQGKSLPIYGDGKNRREWVDVIDHCEAIIAVIKHGSPGESYCVGSGNERENLEVAKKILAILDKPESLITFVNDRPGHDWRYAVSIEKLKGLGWSPQFTFDETLNRTIDWYSKNMDWVGYFLKD